MRSTSHQAGKTHPLVSLTHASISLAQRALPPCPAAVLLRQPPDEAGHVLCNLSWQAAVDHEAWNVTASVTARGHAPLDLFAVLPDELDRDVPPAHARLFVADLFGAVWVEERDGHWEEVSTRLLNADAPFINDRSPWGADFSSRLSNSVTKVRGLVGAGVTYVMRQISAT